MFIETVFGIISIYVIDAEDVPVLGGISLIEQLGMTIDFVRNFAWFEYQPQLGRIPLGVVGNGKHQHRILDLTGSFRQGIKSDE